MILQFNKVHNRFKFNGIHYNFEDLKVLAYSFIKEGRAYEKALGDFLIDWLNHKNYIEVKTSGSTGKPKTIQLQKQAMVNSAIATGDFFKLQPGNKALHCLPSNFIAGKMMLVRAIILGLEIDIVEPTSQPIFDYEVHYDFCAMLPLQLQKTKDYINNIKTIIIGGASVSSELKNCIQNCTSTIFETYGMTETITHVAVKLLNNFDNVVLYHSEQSEESLFKTLPNISISQDKRDCLVIDAPQISKEKIRTNDVVRLHSNSEFEWLGRFDNVINSGGIKIYPEQVEAKLQECLTQRFFIASEKDAVLGEKVILIIEGNTIDLNTILNKILHLKTLIKYHLPKQIYIVNKFEETTSGKIQRKKTLQKIIG